MTRVNCGIPVQNLTNAHLIAEHREIKRIPNILHKAKFDNIPPKFKMGTGHVKFFYDKGLYTLNRYKELYSECIKRGINAQDFSDAWNIYTEKYPHLFNDYIPTEEDKKVVGARILERNGTI